MKLVDATYDADEWVLVKKEPTELMIGAACSNQPEGDFISKSEVEQYECAAIYRDMISAAPIHPSIRDHVEDDLNIVRIKDEHQKLIYAVGRKFQNESRFETALRYIQKAETVTTSACVSVGTL